MKENKQWMLAAILTLCGTTWAWAQRSYDYFYRSWDDENQTVNTEIRTCSSFTPINGTDTEGWVGLYNGWYVVTDNSNYKTLNVVGDDVHLLIPDGVTLTLTGGVKLLSGHKLTIYSSGGDIGQLIVTNSYSGGAGIGGGSSDDGNAGQLVIHGGIIKATGNKYAAGIGGGDNNGFDMTYVNGGITVYGGTVTAQGGDYAAGIGSGDECLNSNAGYVTIYGGTVNATGGTDGAGIGGGNEGNGAMFNIYGGTVNATGGSLAAGIGGGDTGTGGQSSYYGGTVNATGGKNAAGIGGGDKSAGGYINIYGGNITAIGGNAGAGIGGGFGGTYGGYDASKDGNSGTITIEGGNINATGNNGGAGIGTGVGGHVCNVVISAGTVNAISVGSGAGIGSGMVGGGTPLNIDLDITISGGTVTAYSTEHGPGIGVGLEGYFEYRDGNKIKGGEIKITGGTVIAGDLTNSLATGAGIGTAASLKDKHGSLMSGSIIISDANVTAVSLDGAGIGPGVSSYIQETGLIWIKSGTVKASSTNYSAIGKGLSGYYISENTGTVMIHGGVVELNSGEGFPAVSLYKNKDTGIAGRINLANELMVKNNGEKVGADDRITTLTGKNQTVKVEPCDHSAQGDDGSCLYCLSGSINIITLADASDNSAVLTGYDGKNVKVTLTGRTLYKDGSWNTLCLPFSISDFTGTPLEGATVKTLSTSTFSDGLLTLNFSDNLTAIESGKPYILKWDSGDDIVDPVFDDVTIVSGTTTDVECDALTFHGIYSPYSIGSDGDNTMLYMGADNNLYWPNAAMTIGAFRSFFSLADGITASESTSSSSQGIHAIVLNFDNGSSTDILSLSMESNSERAGTGWFTIDGRRLSRKPSQKGIYINNGLKIVIK